MIDFDTLEQPQDYDQAKLFITSLGKIKHQEAINTITSLADQSFAHVFVGSTPTSDYKSDPFAYNTTN